MTHVGSSVWTTELSRANKVNKARRCSRCRQRSGADFSQLMFSDAADPSAKTTADLWPSLSHTHTTKALPSTGRQSRLPRLSGWPTGAAMSGSWQQGRRRAHRHCYSRTSSHSQSASPAAPALSRAFPPRAHAARTLTALMSHFGALK